MAPTSAALKIDLIWDPAPMVAHDLGLAPARQAIEGRFLAAGDALAEAVQGISTLIGGLGRLSESLTADALALTTSDLSRVANELRGLAAAHRSRQDRIQELAHANAAVAGWLTEMQTNLAYLQIFAINIKITSGGTVAAGPAFISFGQEIADRVALGRGQLDAFDKDLSSLDAILATAKDVEDDLGRFCETILPSVPNSLLASAEALGAHHARVAGIASEVSVAAKAIQAKVVRTLGALQIGDITRQRIEHVEQGLEHLDRNPALADVADDQRQRIGDAVRCLLAAQLMAATRDFHNEAALVCETMDAIARDAASILQLKDVASGGQGKESQNVLKDLADNVDRALQGVARTEEAAQAAEQVSRSAVEAARALGGRIAQVQAMRADVQMMALNTSLRCTRIGDTGRPLKVIALELGQQADYLETSADSTAAALEDLARHADRSPQEAGLAEQPADTAAGLADAVTRIREASRTMDEQVETVAEQGNHVVQGLNAALRRLDFHSDLGATLDAALDRLRQAIGPNADYDADDRAILAPIMIDLAAAYTMANERDLHREVLAELGLADLPMSRPHAAEPAANDADQALF